MNLTLYLYEVHYMIQQEATNEVDAVSLRSLTMMQQEATNEFDAVSLRRSFYDTSESDQRI